MGQTMAGPGEIVRKLSDYRDFGGIMLPTAQVQEAGMITLEIKIDDITINGDYDESVFEKPDGL